MIFLAGMKKEIINWRFIAINQGPEIYLSKCQETQNTIVLRNFYD